MHLSVLTLITRFQASSGQVNGFDSLYLQHQRRVVDQNGDTANLLSRSEPSRQPRSDR